MAISEKHHKAVIVPSYNASKAMGFPHIYSAIAFIERQMLDMDTDKVLSLIGEAMIGGTVELNGDMIAIMDIESYFDIYSEDEDNEDDE